MSTVLAQACLMENPKSYSSWHHRKWVVVAGNCDLEKELALIARWVKFKKQDHVCACSWVEPGGMFFIKRC